MPFLRIDHVHEAGHRQDAPLQVAVLYGCRGHVHPVDLGPESGLVAEVLDGTGVLGEHGGLPSGHDRVQSCGLHLCGGEVAEVDVLDVCSGGDHALACGIVEGRAHTHHVRGLEGVAVVFLRPSFRGEELVHGVVGAEVVGGDGQLAALVVDVPGVVEHSLILVGAGGGVEL